MVPMRALVVSDRLAFIPDHARPTAPPGEALIRITRGGICNTDVEILKGYLGFRGVLGHEFVGVVEAFGSPARPSSSSAREGTLGEGVTIGDRVVGEINCVPHDSGSRDYFDRAQDPARTTLGIDRRDGAFADYAVLPVVNLHRVPDGVSDDEAVFVEPLAAACQILEQVHITPSDRVTVLGDGKLGLLCAMALATTACHLTVVGRHPNKLELARCVGAEVVLAGMAGPRPADVVVDCTGSPDGFISARSLLRPRGTLVLKSTYAAGGSRDDAAWGQAMTMTVVDEITIVGSRCGPFAAALRLLARKQVDVRPLIHARYRLEDGSAALDHAQRPGVLKVLLDVA
jgi:threonine dehydrogenase-like Zn-dependent dehydrogenase